MNWYKINNNVNNKLSISIDDEIGGYGISAKSFIDEVKASNSRKIELTINSGGGSVFDALAIYDFLKNSNYTVSVKIEGLAASAATIISLAGKDKPKMTANSFFMIHNAWMPVVSMEGMDSNEIREYVEELEGHANLMDKINDKLAKIYDSVTGLGINEIKSMMDKDTWMDSNEAYELGFVSEVVGAVAVAAYVSQKDLEKKGYKNIPKNYVNQLNNVDMSENNEGLLNDLKAWAKETFLNKKEEVKEEPKKEEINIEELKASIVAEVSASVEAKDSELAELKSKLKEKELEVSAKAEELETAKADIEKAKASREELPAKEDKLGEEKAVKIKDELGAAIMNVFKNSGLI
jgi:ATP-dependent protease ClpP protease subunit